MQITAAWMQGQAAWMQIQAAWKKAQQPTYWSQKSDIDEIYENAKYGTNQFVVALDVVWW